jgi:hypothetical protein
MTTLCFSAGLLLQATLPVLSTCSTCFFLRERTAAPAAGFGVLRLRGGVDMSLGTFAGDEDDEEDESAGRCDDEVEKVPMPIPTVKVGAF